MDLKNLLVWWIHFLLGFFGWITGWETFPEEIGFGNKDPFNVSGGFCENVRDSMARLSPKGSFDGQILIPSDGHEFGKAREQYASVTFAQELSPSVIALVQSEGDVQAAVRFATKCNFSVSIRSGGHSYLGTSSCDSGKGACIQIDVTGINHQVLLPGQVKLGPGNRLKAASEFLKQNGRFLPTGECPGVALGGHMQTGGVGLFTRHFGPFVNRVESFRIVLADGALHNIVTPTDETTQLNDDIFYAVLGGASGSWGVVTEMTLNTINDADYFSVYWKLAYWWDTDEDTDGISNMMRTWAKLAHERQHDWRWSSHWSVVGAKNVPGLGNRIQMEGSWVVPIEQKDDYDFDFFQAIDDACINCNRFRYINVTEPLSQIWRHRYLRTLINKGTGREFPVPYTRSMQQTESFPDPDGMEGITRAIGKLLPSRFSPHFIISQLVTLRGAEPNRALPWPKDLLGITLDYFYVPPSDWVVDHNQRALDFGKELRDHLHDQDHRMYWAAYDSPSLDRDWPKYFESEDKYRRLQVIKGRYDPQNVFQNEMSIPLPKRKEIGELAGNQTNTATERRNREQVPGSEHLQQQRRRSTSSDSQECLLHSPPGACLVNEEALMS
ncbi:bridge enzyme-like [Seminavis robusta]|uniref:Bridge enzyme-like n=1 Tax=Seminavis robusta TaxID=568900 RepID=A0A9N8E0G3_9STRA|nr:bridge enzyme-like [Seminavis robusta]|eukprot:Sro502_g155560.1 bridge enzyme-like (611) ;mRNA; f:28427-30259